MFSKSSPKDTPNPLHKGIFTSFSFLDKNRNFIGFFESPVLLFLTRFIDGRGLTRKALKELEAPQSENLRRYLEQTEKEDGTVVYANAQAQR